MRGLGELLRRIRSLWRRRSLESDLDRELGFHLEMQVAENLERGLPPEEARRQARLNFGGVERFKEECRDSRGTRLAEDLGADVRFGLRMFRKEPGFTLAALVTLALGIGANSAIFSVVNGTLLRPLPYTSGEDIVRLRQHAHQAGIANIGFSSKEIRDYRERNRTFDGLVEYHSMRFILLGDGEPEEVSTGVISPGFFELFGVKPLHGRSLVESDDLPGAEAVLILSHSYWQSRFGGDPGVVGRQVEMNDRIHTIVGVLPPLPAYPNANAVFMPSTACPFRSNPATLENRRARMMSLYGRIQKDQTLAAARVDVSRISGLLGDEHPEFYPERFGYETSATTVREELTRNARPTFLILLGTVGLVLLIACANVANLTLSRLIRRRKELAIRCAMGATRGRVLRQMLTESTLLAVAGGALGLALAAACLRFLVPFAAQLTPRASEIHVDSMVILFTLGLSVLTGIVSGLIPAIPTRSETGRRLQESADRTTPGAGASRVRGLLLVAQLALSSMLLIGAGLMVRSLIKLTAVDPGFRAENVLTMEVNLNWSKYTNAEERRAFFGPFLDSVRALPGVQSAALASNFPLNGGIPARRVHIEGQPVEEDALPLLDFRSASPGYFETMGIPIIRGRTFTELDHEEAPPVAIINASMARHFWGGDDPLGRRISFDGENWVEIIGVVGDVRQYGLEVEASDEFYLPWRQSPGGGSRVVLRSASPPAALGRQVVAQVYRIDPEQPVTNLRTLGDVRADAVASPRLTTILLGMFAALALVISATGIGAVTAFSVSQRTHEIGIRLALGAGQARVLYMVLRQGMLQVLVGLALGLTGALFLARVIERFLFGIGPGDPMTFLGVALVLAGVAAISCLLPARRATTIEPMRALRAH